MPRHAAPKTKQGTRRSSSAEAAHRAGRVTRTITIGDAAALDHRQRATAVLARHGWALTLVAAGFWIYDIGLLIRH